MKKQLLILICLFVSFEVKSESDNLSGKQLICESPNKILGYKFLKNFKVKIIRIEKHRGTMTDYTTGYSTNPAEIFVGDNIIINRLNLKINTASDCSIIKDEFESYINDKLEKVINQIKSKQKI